MTNTQTAAETVNRCDDCGLEFFYAPRLHECRDESIKLPSTTWAEECVAKVMGPR